MHALGQYGMSGGVKQGMTKWYMQRGVMYRDAVRVFIQAYQEGLRDAAKEPFGASPFQATADHTNPSTDDRASAPVSFAGWRYELAGWRWELAGWR
jgi:hypothetical protein